MMKTVFITLALFLTITSSQGFSKPRKCSVDYKGIRITFEKCKLIGGGIMLYWTVSRKEKKISTLIRAKSNGFIAFGWDMKISHTATPMVVMLQSDRKANMRRWFYGISIYDREPAWKKTYPAEFKNGYIAARYEKRLGGGPIPKRIPSLWGIGATSEGRIIPASDGEITIDL